MNIGIPNARFWIFYHTSPVKITLRPGQEIRLYVGRKTDEGWACESDRYRHEGQYVTNRWVSDGRDCDGRLTETGRSVCRIDKLNSIPANEDFPYFDRSEWHKEGHDYVYDENAIAAGY